MTTGESHTARLLGMGLIGKNAAGQWILVRDLRQINLYHFSTQMPWPLPQDEQLQNILLPDGATWLSDLIERIRQVNDVRLSSLNCSLDQLLSK